MSEQHSAARFTKNELIERAKHANRDIAAGKIKSQEQVEKESEKW